MNDMKFKYLGTAAAEGIPAIFCECEVCKKSRVAGGRNIRTRSQAIINEDLLIDFPADTYMHALVNNLEFSKVKSCIITHSHSDHLYASEIEMRKHVFSYIYRHKDPLVFYSDKAGYDMLMAAAEKYNTPEDKVQIKLIKLFEPFETAEGYRITALRAAHDPRSTPVVYIVEKEGKSLFYSNDTSEYPEESMDYLSKIDRPLDMISLDCTECCSDTDYMGHLNLGRCIKLRDRLLEIGAADSNTVFVLNHFSHNGKNSMYDDFVKIASEYDFLVSYDGMEIDI